LIGQLGIEMIEEND